MPLTASCHCGATQIALTRIPAQAHTCNCSYCQKAGALWGSLDRSDFTVTQNTGEATYDPNHMNVHHFCSTCGMQTWGESPDWSSIYNDDGTLKPGATDGIPTTKSYTVNLNLVDDLDRSKITITAMNGRENW